MIVIDEKKCDSCDICVLTCPGELIEKGPKIKKGPDKYCIECGHCVAVCPNEAITLRNFERIEINVKPRESRIDKRTMMSFLKGRRSVRNYKPGLVSKEDLEEIIEAASNAPSAHNARAVKAYVCQDKEVIEKIRKRTKFFYRVMHMYMKLPGIIPAMKLMGINTKEYEMWEYTLGEVLPTRSGRDALLYGAETLLIFTVPLLNPTVLIADAQIAAQNAVTYAESINVGSCYNGFVGVYANFDPAIRKALGVPWKEAIIAVLTMGYPKVKYAREAPRRIMPTNWVGPNA
ncbi:MAG: nitroreductase family protein [Actinobacteria bacterium]|nr:nitroreductase family protein [Actinomycetota bacterium]